MEDVLEVLKLFDDYQPLDKIKEFPDVYNNEVKNIICKIIKNFLVIIDDYYIYDIKKKALISTLLYTWMVTYKKKMELFFDKHPKFRKVCYEKLLEFDGDKALEECPYWKGSQYYIDNLTGIAI